jgi:uncharacterized protein YciI
MPYLIDATDKPDAAALRQAHRPDHLAYLEASLANLIAAGAKLRDDGVTAWGSVYILAVETRAEAEAFIAADPFARAGLFEQVAITRWRKGFFDHQRVPQP